MCSSSLTEGWGTFSSQNLPVAEFSSCCGHYITSPLPSPKESSLFKEKGDITLLRVLSGFLKMLGFGQQVKRKPSSLCILTCYMPLFFLPSCCYDASVQSPGVRNQFQSGNLPLVCLYVCRSCRYVPVLSIKLLSFLY